MKRTDKLAKIYIVPSLKKGGFKKRRLAWNRVREGFIDVIAVQKSRWKTEPDDESFTINIGVIVPEFEEIIWSEPYKEFAKHPDGVFQFRSGNITQEGFPGWNTQDPIGEIWWDLRTDEDVEKAGVEVRANIEDKLLPFLDSMDDFRKLHDVLDKTGEADTKKGYPLPKINFALLKNAIGEKEDAIAILKDLIAKDEWTDHAKRVLSHVQGVKKQKLSEN